MNSPTSEPPPLSERERIEDGVGRLLAGADTAASLIDVAFEAIKRGLIIGALLIAGRALDLQPLTQLADALLWVLTMWIILKLIPYTYRWMKVSQQPDRKQFRSALDRAIFLAFALGALIGLGASAAIKSVELPKAAEQALQVKPRT